MKLQPLDLLGGYGKDDSTAWSPRDCVNYIPELAEDPGARSRLKLRGAPGLKAFATTGTGTRAIRGARNVEGKFFVVSGTSLLQVATDGTTTTLGTIPGTRRCSLSHNQIPGGNELLVVNGNAGYTWNTVTEAFAQVTDEGYPGAIVADYIDTFLAQVEPFGRYWFHSGQAAAGDYNTLDRYESEASPDRIVTGAVNQLEFVAFNETTTEFFVNTGAANAPFTSKRIVIEHGCAGAFAVGRMDNSLLWYGNDGVFYRLNGYQAEPISTGAVEKAVAGMDGANCFTTVYEDEHHKICYWTFPDGITIGYDAVTQLWHRRASYGLDRWRVNTLTKWNGLWIAGDMSNGVLYTVDWDYPLEGTEPILSDFTCPVIHNNQNNAVLDWLEFLFDTGHPVVTPQSAVGITIAGDMGDGFSGNVETGTYTSTGVLPHTFSVIAGTFPAGLALASDGSWSGTRTTIGSYSWTVQVIDEYGNTATLADESVTGIAPPTVIMGDHAYSGNVGSLSYAGASPLVSFCNGVMPVASDDGLVVAGRAQASAVLGIYEYNMVSGLYSAATITGTKPDLSGGNYIQMLAMSADGERIYALSHGSTNIYTLERTGSLAFSVVQTFASGLIAAGSTGGMTAIVLAPDGDRLAVSVENGRVRTYTIDAAGALTLESTSADGTVNGQCFRLDWVGRYIAQDNIHATGTIRVMDADDGLAVKGSIINSGRRLLGFNADATYLYTVVNSGTYALVVYAFDGSSLTAGNTYATNKSPYPGGRLSPSRGTLLYLEQTNTDGNLYAVGGATLTAGEVLTNGFSNGFWSNPGRAP